MSDGISEMMFAANQKQFQKGVDKVASKSAEEIYVILKDLQLDIQNLYYDDHLQLTRNQWATIARLFSTIKELT